MTKNTVEEITVARSSITGQFVTMATAQRNPRETEVEHYRKPTKK